jgi:hypothetical protein
MKTIQARITRNVKEDPSIPEWDIWNIECMLLEKLPDQEARLAADPKEIPIEQISGSRLDRSRTILTFRTQGRSLVREGDTIHIRL